MREIILIIISLITGIMMSAWAIWNIITYIRADKQGRYKKRLYFRISLFIALIGLADFAKGLQSLIKLFY